MTPLKERIARNTTIDVRGCWLWLRAVNHAGYGLIKVGSRTLGTRRMRKAHQVSYEEHVGPIPSGLELDHICRVRCCANPAHLEPVTGAENTRRARVLVTHCPSGHEYNEANTRLYGRRRHCRTCARERQRIRRAK